MTNEKLSRVREYLEKDDTLPDGFISRVLCSDFLPGDSRAFAVDSVLKQQHDQCWVAYARKTSQNACA